jgi:manganese efflux pump family protein
MNLFTMITVAVALAMDAFAVSIGSGAAIHKMRLRHALRVGLFFGFFQAVMPVLGWSLGQLAAEYIERYDHWLAFGLLSFIGLKMIIEARDSITECQDEEVRDPLNFYILVVLSVATSIDAAVVGITLSFLQISIILPILIIGVVTFAFSFSGMYIGMFICDRGSDAFSKWVERAGGVVLIGIGFKILIEHLYMLRR